MTNYILPMAVLSAAVLAGGYTWYSSGPDKQTETVVESVSKSHTPFNDIRKVLSSAKEGSTVTIRLTNEKVTLQEVQELIYELEDTMYHKNVKVNLVIDDPVETPAAALACYTTSVKLTHSGSITISPITDPKTGRVILHPSIQRSLTDEQRWLSAAYQETLQSCNISFEEWKSVFIMGKPLTLTFIDLDKRKGLKRDLWSDKDWYK